MLYDGKYFLVPQAFLIYLENGYLKKDNKPSAKCQYKQTYNYPELRVKQKYL